MSKCTCGIGEYPTWHQNDCEGDYVKAKDVLPQHPPVTYDPKPMTIDWEIDRLMEDMTDDMASGEIRDRVKAITELAYKRGFADAKEKATKVCEEWPGPGGIVHCEEITDQGVLLGHRKGFALAIRALESDK